MLKVNFLGVMSRKWAVKGVSDNHYTVSHGKKYSLLLLVNENLIYFSIY